MPALKSKPLFNEWKWLIAEDQVTDGYDVWFKKHQRLLQTRTPRGIPEHDMLEQLATFVGALRSAKFNFSSVVSSMDKDKCGTVCCAIGWTPSVFPDKVRWTYRPNSEHRSMDVALAYSAFPQLLDTIANKYLNYDAVAAALFNIPREEALYLFEPDRPLQWFYCVEGQPVSLVNRSYMTHPSDYPATPKNVAASIRAYIAMRQTDKRTDPEEVLSR